MARVMECFEDPVFSVRREAAEATGELADRLDEEVNQPFHRQHVRETHDPTMVE